MSKCKDCRYWRHTGKGHAGQCDLLSGPGLFDTPRRAMTTGPDGRYAAVMTTEDFGCADFAEKDLDETVAEE